MSQVYSGFQCFPVSFRTSFFLREVARCKCCCVKWHSFPLLFCKRSSRRVNPLGTTLVTRRSRTGSSAPPPRRRPRRLRGPPFFSLSSGSFHRFLLTEPTSCHSVSGFVVLRVIQRPAHHVSVAVVSPPAGTGWKSEPHGGLVHLGSFFPNFRLRRCCLSRTGDTGGRSFLSKQRVGHELPGPVVPGGGRPPAGGEGEELACCFLPPGASHRVPFVITHVYLHLLFHLLDRSCQRLVYFDILLREWIFDFSSHPVVSFLF